MSTLRSAVPVDTPGTVHRMEPAATAFVTRGSACFTIAIIIR